MRRFDLIFFDADDTLFSVTPSVAFHYRDVLLNHGFEVCPDELALSLKSVWDDLKHFYENPSGNYRTFPARDREWWREFSRRVTDAVIGNEYHPKVLDDYYHRFADPETRALSTNLETTLKTLAERGYTLGVFTNNDSRVKSILEGHKVDHYFSHILTAECIGIKKPSPDAFLEINRRVGIPAEKAVYIGDSHPLDYVPARTAGWHSILFDPETKHNVEHSVVDIGELLLKKELL
jgi:putative hydrolase of the HAD superfamily